LAVAIVKLGAGAAVLWTGFRAVSDDDYARVVIAEEWARAPKWDASGTSWLPFPFWIAGAAMKVAGRGLDTARGVAVLLGIAAALLVYAAARWIGEDRGAAAGGAIAASVFPWSARLGVATVPELFTAALSVLAMAALATREPRKRWIGGAAICAAALSRYEAWPIAIGFAALCGLDAARAREGRRALLGAGAIAIAGPLAWMVWNRVAHGDALHFLARVAAYRQALGAADGAAGRLWAYPVAMVREEPEIAALLVIGAVTCGVGWKARLSPYARPAAMVAAQIAALSLAMIKDGAPTHHPERAVLAALLLAATAGGALFVHAARSRAAWKIGAILGGVVLAGAIGRSGAPREGFVHREDEEAAGRAAAAMAARGERVLVEVVDYGHLAVTAALGRPEDVEADRSVDPRLAKTASSFRDAEALRSRLAAAGARWVIARPSEVTRAVLGEPRATRGAWAVFAGGGGT
jgi:hypothetical protein